jgi:mannose-1-phosphate guanylyltransferase
MLHAVIMAGGSGTRFWPASRAGAPKQLLNLASDRTMLQATVDRLGSLIPPERVMVVTSERLAPAVRQQLPQLAPAAVVGEPCRRDTAGCIGLAAILVAARDPEATLAVFPSDHVIETDAAFQQALSRAESLVASRPGAIVTFGIKPTYPAESFGYIERGAAVPEGGPGAYAVSRFREKPKADVARQYVASGSFYWNSGIFVWKARTILAALAAHRPKVHAPLLNIAAALGRADYEEVYRREFAALESVSIDYAVLEHHPEILVIEAPYTWDDVGSWQALTRLRGVDADGNTIVGRHLGVDTKGSIIRTDGQHLVATLGVSDLIVIHTPDATLVANKHDEEAVRKLVKLIEERGWQEYL